MQVVAVLALDGVSAFDLAIPCQVFAFAARDNGTPAYEVRVCADRALSAMAGPAQPFSISAPYGWDDVLDAATVVVPGIPHDSVPDPRAVRLLREAAARGARIASICTGAFALGHAGLLEGRRATTHWRFADRLAERFPGARVDPSVLYVDEGQVLTSAGIAAGLDLCLHMVRRDHGAAAAAAVARLLVMPPQRTGGQAQFIEYRAPEDDSADLGDTLQWMRGKLNEPLSLADIAAHAMMSRRSLSRHFRAQTGTTPLRWLLAQRVQHARELLETTALPLTRVADATGFGSVEALRHHFTRQVGTTPSAYRDAFRM
ncbi:putative transcriptional regulator [Streptomyces ambofaciens ATCC 23877]|uniref:Putative transcriptional regulator n=1 Tax=Streptomyces ambofaciens (strain ATCC 23877 / 3486 / DSM 40053 / JCM 4204 / NBRC 12836 / NRRL B-2516) TaxID=278992 RepID=A3KIF9_STRA7|nr:helix-turn-helix domain-containing protein [Streptomyces ambofaciens]AKZ53618.1 putative transcriptional regulator [Streptomyces ambofaciens ATCC 23877]CAJ89491.1 putative transcriptional regulator [Streptomyces ambofaciens ATCC 23877]